MEGFANKSGEKGKDMVYSEIIWTIREEGLLELLTDIIQTNELKLFDSATRSVENNIWYYNIPRLCIINLMKLWIGWLLSFYLPIVDMFIS